jgi:hypothetical protein
MFHVENPDTNQVMMFMFAEGFLVQRGRFNVSLSLFWFDMLRPPNPSDEQ